MRTFDCTCGNQLFFENTHCTSCHSDLGFCPACHRLAPLKPGESGQYLCGHADCGAVLIKCHNYAVENVCNRCITVPGEGLFGESLCDCCRFNQTIPDLSVPNNRHSWSRLEAAKRRLFYGLDLLHLPRGKAGEGIDPPLAFDFKADVVAANVPWQTMGEDRVFTGHDEGTITINLLEVDDVERERLRVAHGERHRTLIGHFRHEIGHYYWAVLVRNHPQREPECITRFGDHNAIDYRQAKDRYYQQGPPADWPARFATAYASMHPWEDFAETFAFYLEIASVLDTAKNMNLGGPGVTGDLEQMIREYQRLGTALNEMNRAMELKDLVARRFNEPVIEKLRFVHGLVRG
ncbi:MAG: putative zinc-binding metallopeptidase [Phycisphaeraceae bacterium]